METTGPAAQAPTLRIAVVIPGAVSLGAYEAGALTALQRLVRAAGGRIIVDTIVGASAGSITGAVLAHALLSGATDADDDLEDLWVEQASIATLLKGKTAPGRPRAPLSSQLLERWADDTIARAQEEAGVAGAPAPTGDDGIALVMSLANLQGLRYSFAQIHSGRELHADTFRDVRSFIVQRGSDWRPVLETAVASSANALAFAPRQLTRRKSEYPSGIELPGDEATFWYTDGGTVNNLPLGFAFDAVFNPGDVGLPPRGPFGEERLFLLVHPHPDGAPSRWPEQDDPTFRGTALRSFNLMTTQSIFDDLRHAEKMNTRIEARLAAQLDIEQLLPGPSGATGDDRTVALVRAIGEAAWSRKQEVRGILGRPAPGTLDEYLAARPGPPPTIHDVLDFALDEITGTADKRIVTIEVVSPELYGDGRPVADQLAGEKLGHFFGFALKEARMSDFGLGYRNLRAWWDGYRTDPHPPLPGHPLEQAEDEGAASLDDLGWRKWWLGLRVGLRYLRELL